MSERKTILFVTKNRYLYRKAEIELSGIRLLSRADAYEAKIGEGASDVLVDLDTAEGGGFPQGAVFLSRDVAALSNKKRSLLCPFPIGALAALLTSGEKNTPKLSLVKKRRAALLSGREIRFSELEYALLERLVEADGAPVAREELAKIFPKDATPGMINVYVHYLREKLETEGEKIILSGRNAGYRINENCLRTEAEKRKETGSC